MHYLLIIFKNRHYNKTYDYSNAVSSAAPDTSTEQSGDTEFMMNMLYIFLKYS